MGQENMTTSPVSLYIHLPWCLHKCAYCDFNSHATNANEFPEHQYVSQLIADLTLASSLISNRQIKSIFIGGGTPSLFSPESINNILAACKELTNIQTACEITLETNPGTFESQKFAEFLSAGVNRVSIGAQSFNNDCLVALERIHDREEALLAIHTANHIGFKNINVDLMFGLPTQTIDSAIADVTTVCEMPITHVSYYQLTLEPNTIFHRFPPALPSEDTVWEIQSKGMHMLTEAGFERYEVSAYAYKGMQCVHNTNYWQYGDYLGIGAGAHSKLTTKEGIIRQQRTRQPTSYIHAVETNSHIVQDHLVDSDSLLFEFMLNNLRLNKGFSIHDFTQTTGISWPSVEAKIRGLIDEGLLEQSHNEDCSMMFRASPHGYQFLDELTQRFLP